jgi:hypothetical protein
LIQIVNKKGIKINLEFISSNGIWTEYKALTERIRNALTNLGPEPEKGRHYFKDTEPRGGQY